MDWFRYHTDALDNPKVQELPPELFKFWVNLLCLARLYDGVLPDDRTIAFRLRMPLTSTPDNGTSDSHNTVHKYYMDATSALHELEMRGLLDRTKGRQWVPHDWSEHQYVSDNVTLRTRKHRMKRSTERSGNVPQNVYGNVSGTAPDTEQIQIQSRADTEAAAVPTVDELKQAIRSISPPPKNGTHKKPEDRVSMERRIQLHENVRIMLKRYPGAQQLIGNPDDEVIGKCIEIARRHPQVTEENALNAALAEMVRGHKAPTSSWMWFPAVIDAMLPGGAK